MARPRTFDHDVAWRLYRRRIYGEVPAADVDYRAFVWPCGCVTVGARNGPLSRYCGEVGCYRRAREVGE